MKIKLIPFYLIMVGLVVWLGILIYFNVPRDLFTYNEPLTIVTTESKVGGEITWRASVCREHEGGFKAMRFLVGVKDGGVYPLPEQSVISTLKPGQCAIRERTTVISEDIPPGEYTLMIKTKPDPSIYNFREQEIRSSNTINIK